MATQTPPAQPDGFRFWPLVKDLLSLAVLPLLGWAINLQVNNALQDERIVQMQLHIDELREQSKELDAVKKDVQEAAVHMARLEGKIDMANGRLDEIRSILGR
jgi:FtsZ-binding cell division protein ZapB